ncbi:MAG: hypothetical protein Q8R92_19775 [Deltaproteobacteria bacterium]|nr:hypothetical protein [Deltaproteobacteria bacterium]
MRTWFLVLKTWRIRHIPADGPCWKGEIQVGPFLIGWQSRATATAIQQPGARVKATLQFIRDVLMMAFAIVAGSVVFVVAVIGAIRRKK